jgi:hypothetical protein
LACFGAITKTSTASGKPVAVAAADHLVRGANSRYYYYPTQNIKNGARILKKVTGSRIGSKDIKQREKYEGQEDKKIPHPSLN